MKYFDVRERPNHCFLIQGNTFPNGQYALLMPRNIRYFRPVIIKRFLLQLNTTFCPKIQTTWIIFQHLLTKLSDDSIETRFRGQLYQTPPKTIVGKHQEDLLANVSNVLQLHVVKVFQNKGGHGCYDSCNLVYHQCI